VPSSTPAQLGVVIQRHREARGLSVEALAAEAGIHRTYVPGIESGEHNPSWRVIGAIADALGVKISDLAREAEAATKQPMR
jgi:transcriptional regulator with XRE-family HTH domain